MTNGCGVVCGQVRKLAFRYEFDNRFTVFTELEKDFALFRSPFTIDASVFPEAIQMELIELQCCAPLKDNYASVAIKSF